MAIAGFDWNMLSAIATAISLPISLTAIFFAWYGTKKTNQIAKDALDTANKANNISLGLAREPTILEFALSTESQFNFDFTNPLSLKPELKNIITVINTGKMPIDAVSIEVIGIKGLTCGISDKKLEFDSFPSHSARLNFREAIHPEALAHIDIRTYFLIYLDKLCAQLVESEKVYSTVVNVVLSPKAINEPIPSSARAGFTIKDRRQITIKFSPKLFELDEIKEILHTNEIPHRVIG